MSWMIRASSANGLAINVRDDVTVGEVVSAVISIQNLAYI